ncbi:histidine phosphatase family protein [Erysipelothrix sp. HDW6A]|uniref:histidine phosphatase family protein n=1 Tax=Erysipelothrix sp. HDW6A TaxID=2714928 RepID=UPI00140E859E|nr:histidine phosphatase family protein [Erysipelothrix sp. HDW6A]QIK58098.1 histidine phosphatase family protein [Erysipelothrix sp. HDW6A]
MKNIYLVRHGQTLFNVQHKIQGFCDSPLTEIGIKQAEIARDHINELGLKFDSVHASTSERAIDTLKIITDMNFEAHKDLREWNFGRLEAEGEHLNPPLPYGDFFVQFGGEDELEIRSRIARAVKEIADHDDHENILIVSHGAAIAQFIRSCESTSSIERKGRIQNCSIFRFEYENEVFSLEEIIQHDFSSIEG